MKALFFPLALLLTAFLASCACESTQQASTLDTLQSGNSTVLASDTVPVLTPMLDKLLEKKAKAKASLDAYKLKLSLPKQIADDKGILELFRLRDEFINAVQYEVLENYFFNVLPSAPNSEQHEQDFEKELGSIGLWVLRAEGQYVGLAEGPVMEARLAEVASAEMKLYIEFILARSGTLGGEYPYADLTQEMKMVRLGEKMRKEFSSSELTKKIENYFMEAVAALTDYHTGPDNSCVLFSMSNEAYPNACGADDFPRFVKEYGDTQLSKVVAKINENASYSQGEGLHYVIICEWFDSVEKCKKASFDAMMQGKDIPHTIAIKTDSGDRYALAYRFYADEAKAKEELPKAQTLHSKASVVQVNLSNAGVALAEEA